ncbi:MAG: DUF3592 domain-containing protein [Taibaiella sp.]|nr:DUF3592 domain-containing protein [Taibaiella sp.]
MKHLNISRAFLMIAWISLLIGAGLLARTWSFAYNCGEATGVIIRNDTFENSETFVPVVSFRDEAGKEYQFVSGIASSPAAFRVGDEVKVYYEPAQPQVARINSFFQMYLTEFILVGLGFIFYILSMVFKKIV